MIYILLTDRKKKVKRQECNTQKVEKCLKVFFISEPRISCTSHIMMKRCNLTCKLLEGRNDDEDDEEGGGDGGDSIERMTLW